MAPSRKAYRLFYDHIHSRYYNLLIQWCLLPFGGESKCRKALIAPVDFSPDQRILDLCCGSGGATWFIADKAGRGSQTIGVDLSFGQIRKARKRSKPGTVQFMVGDAAFAPFREHFFDKVFVTHALHEMPRALRHRVLAEAQSILKDNGSIVVLEIDNPQHLLVRLFIGFWFFYWLPFNFETSTRRDMLRNGLVEEVEEAGFRNVTKTSMYSYVFQTVQGIK
jgi:demethylmenaquinone methyltransferase/2-methoxy-6-polyprenyl-1,4-benzoquinol methylase